ncbi:MAG: hexose kinase [Anaerolineaceae bacterium]|nr:hexose kinase [Anaerolineaceae bacterium]
MPSYDLLVAAPNSAIDSYYDLASFQLGQVNKARHAFHTAGGKGFNAARAMKNLGGRAMCTGVVAGSAGTFITQELDREGIAHDLVWSDGETRRCNTIHFPGQADTTIILENGSHVNEETVTVFSQRILHHCTTAPFTALVGSLPVGFPPAFYAHTIRQLKALGARVCLDSSGLPLQLAAEAGPWMIKVNREEFTTVFQDGAAPDNFLSDRHIFQRLHEAGLEYLVITSGKDGAYLYTRDAAIHVQTPVQQMVSSAGSGDTFLSGLLLELGRGHSLKAAAGLASAAAAANLLELGCGIFQRPMVDDLLEKTHIQFL